MKLRMLMSVVVLAVLYIASGTSYAANGDLIVNGNLGVGTTTAPKEKAEVNGNMIVSGNLGVGTTTPATKLEVNGTLGFTGGTGPFCIFANACPNDWVDKGVGGFIYYSAGGATCPYSAGGPLHSGWAWCHPKICCTQ